MHFPSPLLQRLPWIGMLWLCLMPGWALGQSASVTVDRNPVVAGEPFRITFEFKDARVNFQRPPALEGVRLINGPSTSNSTQIVNGGMSTTRSYSYTAVPPLLASFRFPASLSPPRQAICARAPSRCAWPRPAATLQVDVPNSRPPSKWTSARCTWVNPCGPIPHLQPPGRRGRAEL